jgi:hypothetical protein
MAVAKDVWGEPADAAGSTLRRGSPVEIAAEETEQQTRSGGA